MSVYLTTVKLHETDAAGVLFFTSQLKIVHDAYEDLLDGIGFGFAELIRNKDFRLPIVHSEADHKAPISVGDRIKVQTEVEHIGETSFTLTFTLRGEADMIVGTARTVHVSVDKKTLAKIPLPEDLLKKLRKLHD